MINRSAPDAYFKSGIRRGRLFERGTNSRGRGGGAYLIIQSFDICVYLSSTVLRYKVQEKGSMY